MLRIDGAGGESGTVVPFAPMLDEGCYESRGLFATNGLFTADAETAYVQKVRELSAKAGRRLPVHDN